MLPQGWHDIDPVIRFLNSTLFGSFNASTSNVLAGSPYWLVVQVQ